MEAEIDPECGQWSVEAPSSRALDHQREKRVEETPRQVLHKNADLPNGASPSYLERKSRRTVSDKNPGLGRLNLFAGSEWTEASSREA